MEKLAKYIVVYMMEIGMLKQNGTIVTLKTLRDELEQVIKNAIQSYKAKEIEQAYKPKEKEKFLDGQNI